MTIARFEQLQRGNDAFEHGRWKWLPIPARFVRRGRAIGRVAGRRATGLTERARSRPFRASLLLAAVGLLLLSPLLLDDLVFRAAYVLRPSDDTVAIDRAIGIADQPLVRLTSGTLSLPPSPTGKTRTSEVLAAMLKSGGFRMALKSPVFEIDLSRPEAASGGLTSIFGLSELFDDHVSPLIEALRNSGFETLTVRDGTIVVDLGSGRREGLTSIDAEIAVKRNAATVFKGTGLLRGEKLSFDLVLGARVDRKGSPPRAPVRGRIGGSLFELVLDGQLNLGRRSVALADAQVEVTVPNVRSLARSLGHMWPSGTGFKDFAARGTLDWNGPTLAMTRGRYWLDGNEATGTLSLTLDTERPQIAGTLAFGTLDTTPYASRGIEATVEPGAEDTIAFRAQVAAPAQAAPPLPRPTSLVGVLRAMPDLRWPMIGVFDADLRLSAEDLRMGGFEAGRTAASVTTRAGQLIFNVAEMVLYDGSRAMVELGLTGTATYPNYTLRGRLEDADIGALSQTLIGLTALAGKGQVVLNLTSSGKSGADVVRNLEGKLDLILPDGATIGCSHRAIRAAVKAQRMNGDICGSGLAVGPVNVGLRFLDGQLFADRAEAVAGGELVSVQGTFEIGTSQIDAIVTSGPIPPPVRTDGTPSDAAAPSRSGDRSAADRVVVNIKGRPGALTATTFP